MSEPHYIAIITLVGTYPYSYKFNQKNHFEAKISYILLYIFRNLYIIRLSQFLIIRDKTDGGRSQIYSILDVYFQYKA